MANREEQLKQITDQLEQGVSEIFTSEKYLEFVHKLPATGWLALRHFQ